MMLQAAQSPHQPTNVPDTNTPDKILYIITAPKPCVQNTWTNRLTLQYHLLIAPVEACIGLHLRKITRVSKRLKELNHVGTT